MKHTPGFAPWTAALVASTALAWSGCSRAQAKTAPDLPPLEVPAAPPRVVEVADPQTLAPGTLVEEPARTDLKPRPTPPPRTDPPRTDARPEPPAVAEPAPPAPGESPRDQIAPTLQTTPAGRGQDVERHIVALIAKARATLERVDYTRLNTGARTQYDQARQFATMAEDALRDRNLVFAQTNAEKAATLASQLSGR